MSNLNNFFPTLITLTSSFVIYKFFRNYENIVFYFQILHENNPFILHHDNFEPNNKPEKNTNNKLWGFINFICNNNPFIIDYSSDIFKEETKTIENISKTKEETKIVHETKFEDKYLERFKKFPNEYSFTDEELQLEQQEYEKLKILYEENRLNEINDISNSLSKINIICAEAKITNYIQFCTISDTCKKLLLQYFLIDDDDKNFDELLIDLFSDKTRLEEELRKIEESTITEDVMRLKAREYITNKKLDQFINNYVLELTPLGNIYMRYNNDKKSFEYFSNNTIPYRYLEPVGRKYVLTYWCKPLFIDIEEELKAAEQRYDEEIKKKDKELKNREENSKQKNILVKLKNYNKDTNTAKTQSNIKMQVKNRNQRNFVLPPQIKANLPNVNQTSNKQLLKENANRYTWEGRLTNFSPLKKIDKKIVDKKLVLTFADFKRMQQVSTK